MDDKRTRALKAQTKRLESEAFHSTARRMAADGDLEPLQLSATVRTVEELERLRESTQSLDQRRAERIQRVRDAYARSGLDYDAEMGKRRHERATEGGMPLGEPVLSYFGDLYKARKSRDEAALQRLYRDASDPSARSGGQYQSRALSTSATAGGTFVGPDYVADAVALGIQAESVLTNLLKPYPLPTLGEHVTVPQITTASGAGSVAENSAVSSTDPVTALLDIPKATVAGRLQVSQQLLELGGMAFDQMIAKELGSSNAGEMERQIAVGAGGAEMTGLFNVASIGSATYTDATPTLPEMLPFFGQAISTMAQTRKRLPDAIAVSCRRWAWMLGQLDSSNRPIMAGVEPPIRTNGSTTGLVGSIGGVGVYATAGIPSNLGAGTNEDRPLIVYSPDLWLLAGPLFMQLGDTHGEAVTLSQQLVLYRYAVLIAEHASAIATVSGTGMILPAGF
jgi:HK97 family phage major capsid protein